MQFDRISHKTTIVSKKKQKQLVQLDVFAYVGFPIIINTRVGVLTRKYVGDYLDLIYSKQQYRDAFIVCLLALSTGCILSLAVAETHRRAMCSTVKPIEPWDGCSYF